MRPYQGAELSGSMDITIHDMQAENRRMREALAFCLDTAMEKTLSPEMRLAGIATHAERTLKIDCGLSRHSPSDAE